ncbi:hypothetical protein C8D88_116142 [Lentzea atacamensis]|uniref:Uncharacterized protein n=1 Tax=Lentzea atacamensis TaxID=531938 RepID=A0A316HNH3_9PSEU|nr:hypothetical protein [Lentzea atacamensis]PWK81730.1 hypothetical protein C8D88_116142 [Lentzea atacamensis]
MATTAVFGAIAGLLSLCRAYKEVPGSPLANVNIFDGPVVLESEYEHPDSLFIGDSGDDIPSGSSQQDFGPYGRTTGSRDENGTILCTAESASGDTDMSARRARVAEIVGAVEDLVRQNVLATSDPTLGGSVLWCRITNQELRQSQTTEGAFAEMLFVVAFRARL